VIGRKEQGVASKGTLTIIISLLMKQDLLQKKSCHCLDIHLQYGKRRQFG